MREIQVIAKCDFCKTRALDGELFWDGLPISIDGVDYLVDADKTCATLERRTPGDLFDMIQASSRRAEEAPKRRSRSDKGQPRTRAANLPESEKVACPLCGKRFAKNGLNLHTTLKHPESKAA